MKTKITNRDAREFIAVSMIFFLVFLYMSSNTPSNVSLLLIFAYTLFICFKAKIHTRSKQRRRQELMFYVFLVASIWCLGALIFCVEFVINHVGTSL